MSEPVATLNTALAGRYRLQRELGRGGMATVYLAEDLRHGRQVAVKILRPELASVMGPDRFTREIAIAARLNHPHIVALYDSGAADGHLFYVMPFIEGESLRQRLDREKQLGVEAALTIVRQVAAALDYAHAQQLIHRDIKPENILLYQGEAMVADFGIALAARGGSGDRLTSVGMALGTPHYMSPEQASGEPVLDARSDVYSLACVLYELLSGEPPFSGMSAQAVIARRFVDTAPSVRRLRATVPPHVEAALKKGMAREPANRFASCGAFAAALSKPPESAEAMPSVAVLPFINLSADPDNEFFGDGVAEDVIAQLSKIRSLKVISRSSAMRFRERDRNLGEIGQALGVRTLLDASVRRAGDRVRIVAQLIDAVADQSLWAETYDRQLTDIFAIQSDVAVQIANALEAELLPQEQARIRRKPTDNLQAYKSYLQGRHLYTRYTEETMEKGLDFFREAIAADPNYALAHVGMAMAYAELAAGQGGGKIEPKVAYDLAMEHTRKALRIDNELGEAHSVLALLKFSHDYDWVGAEAEFKIALQLAPGAADIYDHYGWLCGALERYDEALELSIRAQELDPLAHRSDVAATLLRAGRFDEALAAAIQAVEFDPEYVRARSNLGWAYIKLGRYEEGVENLEHASRVVPGHTMFMAQLGQAYGIVGREQDAREMLRQLEAAATQRYVSPYHLAYVYTGLKEYDRAMDCLERAFNERGGSVYGIKGSFLFTELRSHPRFTALLKKMNLG